MLPLVGPCIKENEINETSKIYIYIYIYINDFKMFINKFLISGFIFDAKVKLGQQV